MLQSSGTINLSQIKTEFVANVNSGVTIPDNLRGYLRGTGNFSDLVPNHSNNDAIAQSGTLNQTGFRGSGYNFTSVGGTNWAKGFVQSGNVRFYGAADSTAASALGVSAFGTVGNRNKVQLGKWNQSGSGATSSLINIRGIYDRYQYYGGYWYYYYTGIAFETTVGNFYDAVTASGGYDPGSGLTPQIHIINGSLGAYDNGVVPLQYLYWNIVYSSGSLHISESNGFPLDWYGNSLYSGFDFISLADGASFHVAVFDQYAPYNGF